MRTAGMVMGIVGGAFALLLSIVLIFGSAVFSNSQFWDDVYDKDYDFNSWDDDYDFDDVFDDAYDYDTYDDIEVFSQSKEVAQTMLGTIFLIPGICGAVAGIMGLVGGIIVKRKNVAAGVLMIIAAVLSLFSFFNIVSMVLFILGGVFALMRERQKPVYAPPYPTPPYYPYAQQPYPQQPYPQQQDPPQSALPPENPPENPQP